MASQSEAPDEEAEHPPPPAFSLHVVSPSVGVSSPLILTQLPVSTTVRELKAKIRDVLPSKPADDNQRLIHRGRMLSRDMETMAEVFGKDTLTSTEVQTLHLVLRPPATETTAPIAPVAVAPQSTIPSAFPTPPLALRPQSTPAHSFPGIPHALHHGMQAQQPLPGSQNFSQHQLLHQVEQVQAVMAQRLQQLQRETHRLHHEMQVLEQQRTQFVNPQASQVPIQHASSASNSVFPASNLLQPTSRPTMQMLINQQQRERAAGGLNGIQPSGMSMPQTPSGMASGRASPNQHRPDHTSTYTREGIGPNGERWQMTVNETTTTLPLPQPPTLLHQLPAQQTNPALELQALLRNADRFAHSSTRRSASNPPAARTASTPTWPGVTRPSTPATVTIPATINNLVPASSVQDAYIPGPNSSAFIGAHTNTASGIPQAGNDPMVYILSSSSGPRALLLNNADMFYSPRQSSRRHNPQVPAVAGAPPVGLPEFRNRYGDRQARRNRRQGNDQVAQPPLPAPHANPGAGAMAAQVGPLLWLMVRLVGFVWFFTSGNPSWTRWLLISGLAFIVFIVNTGLLNGVAEQVLGPIRRHLENLIPLAGPDAALVPAANAVPRNPEEVAARPDTDAAPRNDPENARVAARVLAEQRQANGGWIMTQMRRIEHAALLFLASLVPGVGERHIAAREAEANAAEVERRRQLETANANGSVNAQIGPESQEVDNVEETTGTGADAAQDQPVAQP